MVALLLWNLPSGAFVFSPFELLATWLHEMSHGLASFLLGARYLPDRGALLAVHFVAAQACINAVLDIRVLFRPELVVDGEVVGGSDAHPMASVSFGDHRLWASVWLVHAFAWFYLALRVALGRPRAAASSAPDAAAPGEAGAPPDAR